MNKSLISKSPLISSSPPTFTLLLSLLQYLILMSRAIGSGILLNIFLMRCRGSFLHTTFQQRSIWIWIIVLCFCVSLLLAGFSYGDSRLFTSGLDYTNSMQYEGTSLGLILLLGIIVLGAVGYLVIFTTPKTISKRTLFVLLIWLVSILICYYFGFVPMVLSRALIAGLEEWTKTSVNLAFFDRFQITHSDCLFFGLLSALGFAFTENIVYLFHENTITLGGSLGLIIKRMSTSRMMHLTYSGLIALGVYSRQNNPNRVVTPILFILGGVVLHTLFNYFLQINNILLTLFIIIGGYFFLTWILYKTDRIYLG